MNIAIKMSLDYFVGQLSARDKVELVRRLERETRRERWSGLLSRLKKRAKGKSLSDKTLLKLAKEARKALHA